MTAPLTSVGPSYTPLPPLNPHPPTPLHTESPRRCCGGPRVRCRRRPASPNSARRPGPVVGGTPNRPGPNRLPRSSATRGSRSRNACALRDSRSRIRALRGATREKRARVARPFSVQPVCRASQPRPATSAGRRGRRRHGTGGAHGAAQRVVQQGAQCEPPPGGGAGRRPRRQFAASGRSLIEREKPTPSTRMCGTATDGAEVYTLQLIAETRGPARGRGRARVVAATLTRPLRPREDSAHRWPPPRRG